MSNINKHYREVKKILRKGILVDTYFVSKYSFSPYQACEHGCKYCDGRAEKYFVAGEFDKDIVIRKNLPDSLEKELKKIREIGTVLIGSGISDPYQPVEKNEKLMRRAAEILNQHNLSASVMTKSSLVMRDIDLWQKLNEKNGFTLIMSLTLTDDNQRKVFEPYSSSIKERLETLHAFKEKGCYVGVAAMPFLPYISDTDENIVRLAKELANIDIDFVLPGALTLRPGRQKDLYFEIIKENFPELLPQYIELYKENRQSGAPIYSYRRELYSKVNRIFSQPSISMDIPHYVYKNRFPIYDEVFILMHHMINLYSRKGFSVKELKENVRKYTYWLIAEKKFFNRRRSLNYKYVEEKLTKLIQSEEITNMINDKTVKLLEEVIHGKKLDYMDLSLNF